jgi:hypothetical protein
MQLLQSALGEPGIQANLTLTLQMPNSDQF